MLLLILGPLIFCMRGAVTEEGEGLARLDPNSVGITPEGRDSSFRLSWFEGFGVSVRMFIGLEVPSGSKWAPSEDFLMDRMFGSWRFRLRFSTFATLLRILGWIVVPIAVAAIAQNLMRR